MDGSVEAIACEGEMKKGWRDERNNVGPYIAFLEGQVGLRNGLERMGGVLGCGFLVGAESLVGEESDVHTRTA